MSYVLGGIKRAILRTLVKISDCRVSSLENSFRLPDIDLDTYFWETNN